MYVTVYLHPLKVAQNFYWHSIKHIKIHQCMFWTFYYIQDTISNTQRINPVPKNTEFTYIVGIQQCFNVKSSDHYDHSILKVMNEIII